MLSDIGGKRFQSWRYSKSIGYCVFAVRLALICAVLSSAFLLGWLRRLACSLHLQQSDGAAFFLHASFSFIRLVKNQPLEGLQVFINYFYVL